MKRVKYSVEDAIKILELINQTEFSEQQKKILMNQNGIKIVACAGSGKTMTIVNLVVLRIMTGQIEDSEKLLLTTYSKAGAEAMSDRINGLLRRVGFGDINITVKTLHAVYYDLIYNCSSQRAINILSETEKLALIKQAVRELRTVYLEDEDINKLGTLFSYQINNLISSDELMKSYVYDINLSQENYDNIRRHFMLLKQQQNKTDFDDLQYTVYYHLLSYENIVKDLKDGKPIDDAKKTEMAVGELAFAYLHEKYKYIYVDEFQDTSQIQYDILKRMIQKDSDALFVGDDDQCIYGWRGAKSSILLNVDADYHIDKLHLDTNYRCRKAILEFAKLGISHNERREPKDMRASKDGGVVNFEYMDSRDLYAMSKRAADLIEEKIKANIKPKDIAVLVRNNAHAQVLQTLLLLRGIYGSFSNDIKLTSQPAYKDIESIVGLCGNSDLTYYDTRACESLLWKMIRFFTRERATVITDIMSNTKAGFLDVLTELVSGLKLNSKAKAKLDLNPQMRVRLLQHCNQLSADTLRDIQKLYRLLTEETDMTKRFIGLLEMYQAGTEFLNANQYSKRRNISCIFNFFFDLSKDGIIHVSNTIARINMFENSVINNMGEGVKITTMHSAKGLEWSHVIILAYDNVCFPDLEYLVKKDMSNLERQEYLDGERRLAYVAITRAIDNLTIITDSENMSLFGLEAFGVIPKSFDFKSFAEETVKHKFKVSENYRIPKQLVKFYGLKNNNG